MPELPEVETVRQGLARVLSEPCKVTKIDLRCGDLRTQACAEDLHRLEGEDFVGIKRRAKYLLFEFRDHVLINHLGMTGSWREFRVGEERKHDHFLMSFSGGRQLVFNDPRRFGQLKVVARGEEMSQPCLKLLGPEPLEPDFNAEYLFKETRGRKAAIKVWLMDQRRVVGVGNIYACEALFRAGVRPGRPAGRISKAEAAAIVKGVRLVLSEAIRKGGTTFRDFAHLDGEGGFQNRLRVYDRKAEPCRKCGSPIAHKVIGGRSTYWCRRCQR
jgi:formamidopyrimidine-DNA glycosylase